MALNDKQKMFCDEYLIDMNATQAAIRAGYSKATARHACKWINENESPQKPAAGKKSKFNPEMRAYIDARMAEKESELIAQQDEVLQYLTAVMRGNTQAEVVVVEGKGKGYSMARLMQKAPDESERIRAAELLGKRYGLYNDSTQVNISVPVIIDDCGGDDDDG